MARVHVHRDPTEMVASVKQSATRAFVAVLALLAKSYEVVLAVSRDSSEQELLKAYRKLCSFMSGFTDAFQSSLATPCKIFLAENPSGDKVEVTGSGSGSELHIVPVFREAVLPRDVPTVAARGHQPAVTVHFWILGFGPQGHFRSLDFGIFGFRDFRILGFLDFWFFGFLDFWFFGF